MRIIITDSYEKMGMEAANIVAGQVYLKPNSVLGLATGSTPVSMYERLAAVHKSVGLDFSEVTTFNLDEYIGMSPDNPQSYHYFMQENFFRHINIRPENVFLPNGMAEDMAAEGERYEQLIESKGGIDLQVLGIGQAQVVCCEAETFLQDFTERASLIFIDPARRDSHGQRTYAISDCTPDVVALLPLLLSKCEAVMLKLSPMLDWRKAVADLGSGHVSEVHIVATDGECKELLIVITPTEQAAAPTLYCTDDQSLTIFKGDELSAQPSLDTAVPEAGHYLYEPSATLMKSGCFAALQHRFDACQIATNSHLFVSYQQIADFPGRSFRILSVTSLNKRELQQALAGTTRANIAVRNFPLSAPELRKRLRLSDGGDTYIFATTLSDGRHVVIKGVKEV